MRATVPMGSTSTPLCLLLLTLILFRGLVECNLGTRVLITNKSRWLLRINRMWSRPGQPHFSREYLAYLPPGHEVTFQGHTDGYNSISQSVDVAFLVERFCPGVNGTTYSLLGDSYVAAASYVVDNPPIGYPYIRAYTECKRLPYDDPYKSCKFNDVWGFKEGETRDVGFASQYNSMQATATRRTDSSEYKEFDVVITMPPKACVYGMDCINDWRQQFCNAQ